MSWPPVLPLPSAGDTVPRVIQGSCDGRWTRQVAGNRNIGATLGRLKADRRKAAYDDIIGSLPNKAAAWVPMVRKVLSLLSTI